MATVNGACNPRHSDSSRYGEGGCGEGKAVMEVTDTGLETENIYIYYTHTSVLQGSRSSVNVLLITLPILYFRASTFEIWKTRLKWEFLTTPLTCQDLEIKISLPHPEATKMNTGHTGLG